MGHHDKNRLLEKRRGQLVKAVRAGQSLRSAAVQFGLSYGSAIHWIKRARGKRLNRVRFANSKPGRASNRTPVPLEQLILDTRRELREESALGEFGLDAIGQALEARIDGPIPGRTTIYRVLERHGVLDAVRRQRRAPPPKGWYLRDLARGEAELDTFDFIEDLRIKGFPKTIDVLTATSVHGALADAWIMEGMSARATLNALLERWQREGLPTYAQFDNGSVFQGAHQFSDNAGRITRLCLALRVIPVFATPYEHGFQNAIEGFNGLWQSKVWRRQWFNDPKSLRVASARYIKAYRAKTAVRREAAPKRRAFPKNFKLDLSAPLKGKMIFLRRSGDTGYVYLPGGNPFLPDKHWCGRLVRCELDFTHQRIRFYALRRRDPSRHPLLCELPYPRPSKPFKGKP